MAGGRHPGSRALSLPPGQHPPWTRPTGSGSSLDCEGKRQRHPTAGFVWLNAWCEGCYVPHQMNFRFDLGKATEAACLFLQRGGGRMNVKESVELNQLDEIFALA